jgi:hypothetical protein
MNIQFIGSADETVPTQKGSYTKRVVTFKNLASGKVEAKTLMSFGVPKEVWERLSEAKVNETFSVTTEKDAKGYWQWTSLSRVDDMPVVTTATGNQMAAVANKVNTYAENNKIQAERLQFDKDKQQLIIRQSCLSAAVDLMKDHGKQPNPLAVTEVAQQFVNWVNQAGIEFMSEDQPE